MNLTCTLVFEFLEDAFTLEFPVSLECLVRMFTTIHQNYSFEEVNRLKAYDDIYDVGNLLMICVHHCIALAVRKPDLAGLRVEENLKNIFKMFAVESKVNQILDINSLYLTETLARERSKDLDKRLVTLNLIKSEAHIFLKGLSIYLFDLDFDVSDFAEYPENRKHFLEEVFEKNLFDPLLLQEICPVAENEDYLDSIFFWEFYEKSVDQMEHDILKVIMIVRLFYQVIGMIQDSIEMVRLIYPDPTPKYLHKIVHDNLLKMALKIVKTIKKNKFAPFAEKLKLQSPHTWKYLKSQLIETLLKVRKLCEEVIFFSAILFYSIKEGLEHTAGKIMTSSLVSKIEPQKMKYHRENLETIDSIIKSIREV